MIEFSRMEPSITIAGMTFIGTDDKSRKHIRILSLLAQGEMTRQEVADEVGCGIATVYRVAKGMHFEKSKKRSKKG